MELSNKNLNQRQQDKIPSKRPPDLKFIQQKLPSSHPVLNVAHVLPWFLLLSFIFIPIGIGIWIYADNISELSLQYDNCTSIENSSLTCEEILHPKTSEKYFRNIPWTRRYSNKECSCRVDFELEKDMNGTIYMYYALTNFYQNHLRYYTSRDANQLKGNIVQEDGEINEPSSSCGPDNSKDDLGRTIIPCGLQASTMFNDVIQLSHIDPQRYPEHPNGERNIPLNNTGIAWESDRYSKFHNPKQMDNPKHPIWLRFGKPWGWKKYLWELDLDKLSNNGLRNEDFMVWMRTTAFPNFRKLHRIVDNSNFPFENGLPKGKYSLIIKEYNFEVSSFSGSKWIILSTSRETAGKNYFLALAYMITGAILLVLTLVFFGIYLFTRKRDMEFKID